MHSLVHKRIIPITIFFFCIISTSTFAQQFKEPNNNPPEWSKPYKPFRIVGNLYYVGSYDLACYLITTPQGHILINTGLASSASLIENNMTSLGLKLKDIKILLTTQAHFDHMGAMAEIQKKTGAKVFVNQADAQVMKDGGSSDYALGNGVASYKPVQPNKLLQDKDQIKLGNAALTMLNHPGHTKGSCSFIFDVLENGKAYSVLIANMPTIVTSDKFANIKAYPNIEQDYINTIKAMKALKFDIWLASHASQFKLHQKHPVGAAYNPNAFLDSKGYQSQLEQLESELQRKINKK